MQLLISICDITETRMLRLVLLMILSALIGVSVLDVEKQEPVLRKRLLSLDPRSTAPKPEQKPHFTVNFDAFLKDSYLPDPAKKTYNLPGNEWCRPPVLPPLDYGDCNLNGVINAVPLRANLANGLKLILLSAIKSEEDAGKCFFIDETHSPFPRQFGPFLDNFFEPIGLQNSQAIQTAAEQQRIADISSEHVWGDLNNRRVENSFNTILKLNYLRVEGHELKRNILQRLWRPLPAVRDATCSILQDYLHGDEYIALLISNNVRVPMKKYIDKIEETTPIHFGTRVPLFPVFVVTEDCSAVQELRRIRPMWMFVSQCDHGASAVEPGSKAEMDQIFSRMFVDLFAMAGAKVWIGVANSDLSWVSIVSLFLHSRIPMAHLTMRNVYLQWVYFMRPKTLEKTFYLLDTKGSEVAPMMW